MLHTSLFGRPATGAGPGWFRAPSGAGKLSAWKREGLPGTREPRAGVTLKIAEFAAADTALLPSDACCLPTLRRCFHYLPTVMLLAPR